jgi:hypothetical protein
MYVQSPLMIPLLFFSSYAFESFSWVRSEFMWVGVAGCEPDFSKLVFAYFILYIQMILLPTTTGFCLFTCVMCRGPLTRISRTTYSSSRRTATNWSAVPILAASLARTRHAGPSIRSTLVGGLCLAQTRQAETRWSEVPVARWPTRSPTRKSNTVSSRHTGLRRTRATRRTGSWIITSTHPSGQDAPATGAQRVRTRSKSRARPLVRYRRSSLPAPMFKSLRAGRRALKRVCQPAPVRRPPVAVNSRRLLKCRK